MLTLSCHVGSVRKEIIEFMLEADNVNRIKLSFHGKVQSVYDSMKAFSQVQLKATAACEKAIKK